MAAFILAVFHKLETTKKVRSKLQDCCSLLARNKEVYIINSTVCYIVCIQFQTNENVNGQEPREEVTHKGGYIIQFNH